MKIAIATDADLSKVWEWIEAEPDLHFGDDSPKTFDTWAEMLRTEDIAVFIVIKGTKLVGAVGFQFCPVSGDHMIRGVHFIPEVRRSRFTHDAFKTVVVALFHGGIEKVSARYPVSNVRIHKFFRKLGGTLDGLDGTFLQHGEDIPVFKVTFHANPTTGE